MSRRDADLAQRDRVSAKFSPQVVGAVLLGALGAWGVVAGSSLGCSSGGTNPAVTDAAAESTVACTGSGALEIHFAPMYAAFITDSKTHTFQVPAILTGATGTPTWTASDPAAVSFAPDPTTGGTMITVLSATPVVKITAQVGSLCVSTQLNVTSATEADWQAGNARYNNGVPVYPGCVGAKVAPILGDTGVKLPPPPDGGCPDAGPACTGCHGDRPTGGYFSGVQHTPEQTGGFTDQQLIDIFVNATDPTYDTSYLPYEYWHLFHTWSDISTPAAQKAMVVYLRSLQPIGEDGGVNFGMLHDAGILPD
jgi:hypothetical protein